MKHLVTRLLPLVRLTPPSYGSLFHALLSRLIVRISRIDWISVFPVLDPQSPVVLRAIHEDDVNADYLLLTLTPSIVSLTARLRIA